MQPDKTPSNERLTRLLKELKALEDQQAYVEYDRLHVALELGKVLLNIKKELPHGAFLPFLKGHQVKISPRSAERYMYLAKNRDKLMLLSNSPKMADLTLEKALQLIKGTVKKESVKGPVQIVQVSQFFVASSFDAQAQEYTVSLKVAASDIELLRHKANMKTANAAVTEALLQILRTRNLADLSTFSGN